MKVGLTGGIGCGKTTVVGLFREAGWQTLEADAVVKELLANDPIVMETFLERWGRSILGEAGAIDRGAVAARVFQDEAELAWLESLLHPLVGERWRAFLVENGAGRCLVEIPLLFEKRLETHFDLTVCVASPLDLVEKRMVARGYTRTEIARRSRRQMPLEKKSDLADHLISNSGSLEFLKRQTLRLIEQIA